MLHAQRKVVCSICTVDASDPVMIDEGSQWTAHQRSRRHRRLAAKRKRPREWGGLAEGSEGSGEVNGERGDA